MPLNIYPNIYASGSVPGDWQPSRGGTIKYPVLNHAVLRELRRLRAGRGKKSLNVEISARFTISNIVPVVWQESSSIPDQ
jgi:hypothetical protein